MILLLFSGGVESTVLLKHFLKDTNELIYVLYNKLGYDDLSQKRISEQTKAATDVLNYFKKNYRDFNYGSVKLSLNNISRQQHLKNGFGFDEQWNLFFASMYAKLHNIENIWLAHFSYVDYHRIEFDLKISYWHYDGTLEKYALLGAGLDFNFFKDLKINYPAKNFKKTGIDSFKSKKEAFDYLEPELQVMVRSCEGEEKFCGKCYKCTQYIKYKIKND